MKQTWLTHSMTYIVTMVTVFPLLAAEQSDSQRDEAAAIDAYIYLYPMITMDV
ncbi:MAG: hypothetical protein GY783_08595, partial [Gammaproteobacteria bacterium]|nr:hypothetical protein [Gammaproteobacteria bacterium]